MSSSTLPVPTPSLWRRYRAPLLSLGVLAAVIGTRMFLEATETAPESFMLMFQLVSLAIFLNMIVLPIWFLFFSPFKARTRIAIVLLLATSIGAMAAVTRKVEFTGFMRPIFFFVWDPDQQEVLKEHLASTTTDTKLTAKDVVVGDDDYPRYRGPHEDGVASSKIGPIDWTSKPPTERWRHPIGGGHSAFAVAGKIAVTLEQRDKNEVLACYDRDTGKQIWAFAYPAFFYQSEPMGGSGPRATPTIHEGDVYSVGAMGDLICVDIATGVKKWHVNILADNHATNITWGVTCSPLVVGSRVIVNPGVNRDDNKGQAVAAYDRVSGNRVWASGKNVAGYSSPMLATLAGVPQILLFDAGGLNGIDPETGKPLWHFKWDAEQDMNIMQPLVLPGDCVFISSDPSRGSMLVQIGKDGSEWTAKPAWAKKNRVVSSHFTNPLYFDGAIWILSKGFLTCLDAETGERLWHEGRFGFGQMIRAGTTIFLQSETGELIALAADKSGYRELGRIEVFKGRTWNTPALAGGSLYLRTHRQMVRLDLR